MKALKQQLAGLWAQTRGTRWDVVAGRIATGLGVVAGLAPYAGWIPGRTGAAVAGACALCAGLTPRVTKAAGLLKTAYGQQTPLLKVLPEIVSTLLAGPSIIAQAKAAEADEAKAQAQAEDDKRIAQQVEAQLTKLGIKPGTSKDSLSAEVPADLQAALDKALPPADSDKALPGADLDKALPPAETSPSDADKAQ